MNFPSEAFDEAVAALCHGTINESDLAALHGLLEADPQARDEYLWRVEVHSELASGGLDYANLQDASFEEDLPEAFFAAKALPDRKPRRVPQWALAAAAVLVLSIFGLWQMAWQGEGGTELEVVAHFSTVDAVAWRTSSVPAEVGDAARVGQRIELASGTAELRFTSGARLTMVGPAIVEPRSSNSAFLLMGKAHMIAETADAKGFVLMTPGSQFVDIGTEFTAVVAPDGLSRLEVLEGEVDVVLDRSEQAMPRMRTGETLYIEPGEAAIMTRIESGAATPAFDFPNIAPPSSEDYADQLRGVARIRVVRGVLRERPGPNGSGPVSVLLDGVGQSQQDAPRESAFFETPYQGELLIDLGQAISVTRFNTYSWHQHYKLAAHRERAQQRYTLYGYAGDELPPESRPHDANGWTRIARVNSDAFFQVADAFDRPPQQACSITSGQGEIGRYRYLLLVVHSSTFFGEIDVFGTP